METRETFFPLFLASTLTLALACGDDGTQADRVGVGAECASTNDCPNLAFNCDGGACDHLECLPQFAGGYCGLEGCTSNEECPESSACVAHTDGHNYCFRICADKAECNRNRSADVESNCSANIVFVDPGTRAKACVPPSSGL